jgi:hypothetical protein
MCLTDRNVPDVSPEVLLAALADARRRKEQASRDIRVLLAYAREIAAPRPYRLVDLARVTGLSISGIRTAYTATDIDHAARVFGTPADSRRRPADAAVAELLTVISAPVPGPSR